MRRSIAAVGVLFSACAGLVIAVGPSDEPTGTRPEGKTRLLPGVQPGGAILLPNQWSLRPAGRQLTLGDFPVNLALHPTGRWLAALHAGHGPHEIVIVALDANRQRITCRVPLEQTFYGLCFAPDGQRLFASGAEFEVVHSFSFADGLLSAPRPIPVAKATDKFVPGGIAVDAAGQTLFVAGTWGSAVALVPLQNPDDRQTLALGEDSYPYTCLPDKDGKRLFVSLWGKSAISAIDLAAKRVAATWPTESHPTEMALSPDGRTLYVACANSTRVSVLDTHDGKVRETLSCALYPSAPSGNTPNSLTLTPDGQLLFVANADNNNVAVLNVAEPGKAKSLGFIPVGWYPTSVRYNPADKHLYVTNGKGTTSLANPQGPNPLLPRNQTVRQYIADLFHGTLTAVEVPTPERMGQYTRQAYASSPLRADATVVAEAPADSPIPARLGDASPIKQVIYVIKENRTYDQVFGDMKEGNGDPNLCLFPEKITPNHHKLARQFVLLDNFYVDGEVSADGHQWSMGAYATDFVEKVWPLTYRGSPKRKLSMYPSEGNYDNLARPAGGYLWNRCAEAGVSYRDYGEWVDNGRTPDDPARARDSALVGHFDEKFRGFDLDYPDQKRADRFLEELARFEKENQMPQFIILRLPNDHTAGTRPSKPTPTAMVADNDLALGRIVEGVSRSKFWKDTAIFVIEDDAQNGSDHVDAHRTVALVISPYTKHGQVDSSLYSTTSMLRTMELILGLKPMSQFDAAARPMYRAFTGTADLKAYEHAVPQTDLKATNERTAPGAELSLTFDFSKEDAVDDLLLNRVIWQSVRGADFEMPPPVRAAFVCPTPKKED
jgi:DNA-binding beta-propeller fold protein YncE